ncbi:Slc4a10 [Symbiodinium necroappetens]|uniref:Slc4a10 protein n=1 Tax=Symbiodinium necroappetens TaxID=1628268 RepID=A0A812TMY1_9DINO|nr:Slc4a10 [Symbiodinium necroappetens]
MDRPFPAWGIAYAILPAIGFAVLGYLDQLMMRRVGAPSASLRQMESIKHILHAFLLKTVSGLFGQHSRCPSVQCRACPCPWPSITHVISLTTDEVKQLPAGERKAQHSSWHRLIWDPAKYPQYHYIQNFPISRVRLYTVVQVIWLGILYGIQAIKETSVVFPLFVASLAIIRKAMRFMFTEDELKQLDDLPGEDEEEETGMSKTDIVNLDVKEAA